MNAILGLLLALLPQSPQAPATSDKAPEGSSVQSLVQQVTISGQYRFRWEYRDPSGYSTAAELNEDDDLFLSRLRVNLKFVVNEDVDVFVQPQDSRTFGEETTVASNEKNLDLHQGWMEVRNVGGEPITLRIGRQELQYGDQRLISPLDWSNIGRAWDGLKARYAGGDFWLDAFYTVIKEGTGAEDDQDFLGLYGSYTGVADHEIDGYVLRRTLANNAFTDELGNVGDVKDTTIGARMKGKDGAWDYSFEGAWQTGDYVDTDISAYGVAATVGHTLDMDWKPRIGAEVTYGSGDEDPTDGDRGTFDPLYPLAHVYQGYADVFSWKNGYDVALYVKVAPSSTTTLHLDIHNFFLAEDKDSWYAASGASTRRDTTGASDDKVGTEIDLHVRHTLDKNLKLWGGWSRFLAGPFVDDTGRDPDMDWFFVQLVLDF